MAAPGPSLTAEVAETVRKSGWPVLVCQDAWRLMPWADVLYGCDERWWLVHDGTDFAGEKWSTHGDASQNDKRECATKFGINLVHGYREVKDGFSLDPEKIQYGDNSGFQSINLAILFGSPYIVLVGFNMSRPNGKGHFFGDHPQGLNSNVDYEKWLPNFQKAADLLPDDITIINATPDSALDCFPRMSLTEAIEKMS